MQAKYKVRQTYTYIILSHSADISAPEPPIARSGNIKTTKMFVALDFKVTCLANFS